MKTKVITTIMIMLFLASIVTIAIPTKADGEVDEAYRAISPSYQKSDSPLLQLSEDKRNWHAIIPPEPRTVEGAKDPTAIEIFDVHSKKATRVPSNDPTQQAVEPHSSSTPPYQGLLPPGMVPETVFPPDDRARITPTTPYPWRTIVKLYITAADNTHWIGSGEIIGSSSGHGFHILTAGHCVYMHDNGGWVASIEVIPGLDQTYMPYYHAWVTYMRTYTGWTVYQMHEHDWAVCTLDRNVGDFTGWMGRMTASSGDPVYTGVLNTAGYPSDLDYGLCMYWDADNGRTANEYNHWYYMDTYGGQSGSPVWVYYSSTGERYILTIHAYGNDGSGSNHGTRLNQDKFDRIITWTDSDTPPTDYADLIDDGQAYSGFSPTTVTRGQTYFNLWCRVRNIGTASSGGFYVSCYASTNTVITSSDYLIGTIYVSSISPFTIRDISWSGTFPSSIPSGTYWAGWIIDSGNNVIEFDETNNVAYKSSYQLTVNSPPTCTILSPNGGGWYSGALVVTASASDPDGSVVQVDFEYSLDSSNWYSIGSDTSSGGGWTISWNTGSITDSTVWVRARAKDNRGAYSPWDSSDSSFGVDNSPPNTPSISADPSHCPPNTWTPHNSPYFTWSNPGDSGSGVSSYEGSVNAGAPFTVSSPYHPTWSDGTYTFKVRAVDVVGLRGGWSNIITIKIDTKPPSGSISINAGARYTPSTSVTLTLSANDALSGVAQMRFSNDGSSWTSWQTYATTIAWTLTSGDGEKTVYVQFKDNAGNIAMFTDTIILDTTIEADLVGHGAWPEHHHFVISKDGNPTVDDNDGTPGDQTLYGKVANTGAQILQAGTYKVVWIIVDENNNPVGTYETVGTVELAPGDQTTLTYDLDVSATPLVPGKYSVTAQCYYYDIAGDKIKEFSFAVVP